MRKFTRVGLAGLMAVGIIASAPHAFAAPRQGIVFTGNCSGASTWKLTLSIDNGQVQSEFEVESQVNNQTWNVRMLDNGLLFFKGKASTGQIGSFTVTKFTPDQSGTDNILAQAKNKATGETCMGSGSI